jgi:NUMOD4 motif
MDEYWKAIDDFPNYVVSNFGDVVNEDTGYLLNQSRNQAGIVKVNLIKDNTNYSRSVKVLVGEAFVEGETKVFDTLIQLDGDQLNCRADNLMWRPRWFAWKYRQQFSGGISELHRRGPIRDVDTRERYIDIYEAGVVNGILFKEIWKSINMINPIFRTEITQQKFEFIR